MVRDETCVLAVPAFLLKMPGFCLGIQVTKCPRGLEKTRFTCVFLNWIISPRASWNAWQSKVLIASGTSHLFRGDPNNFQNLFLDLAFINSQASSTNLTVQQKKEKSCSLWPGNAFNLVDMQRYKAKYLNPIVNHVISKGTGRGKVFHVFRIGSSQWMMQGLPENYNFKEKKEKDRTIHNDTGDDLMTLVVNHNEKQIKWQFK